MAVTEKHVPLTADCFQPGRKMPVEIQWILSESKSLVPHQPEAGLEREHETSVDNRIRQPRVAVMAARKKIESLSDNPSFRLDLGQPAPTERASRLGLILAGYGYRIVSASTAEAITFIARSNIFERP